METAVAPTTAAQTAAAKSALTMRLRKIMETFKIYRPKVLEFFNPSHPNAFIGFNSYDLGQGWPDELLPTHGRSYRLFYNYLNVGPNDKLNGHPPDEELPMLYPDPAVYSTPYYQTSGDEVPRTVHEAVPSLYQRWPCYPTATRKADFIHGDLGLYAQIEQVAGLICHYLANAGNPRVQSVVPIRLGLDRTPLSPKGVGPDLVHGTEEQKEMNYRHANDEEDEDGDEAEAGSGRKKRQKWERPGPRIMGDNFAALITLDSGKTILQPFYLGLLGQNNRISPTTPAITHTRYSGWRPPEIMEADRIWAELDSVYTAIRELLKDAPMLVCDDVYMLGPSLKRFGPASSLEDGAVHAPRAYASAWYLNRTFKPFNRKHRHFSNPSPLHHRGYDRLRAFNTLGVLLDDIIEIGLYVNVIKETVAPFELIQNHYFERVSSSPFLSSTSMPTDANYESENESAADLDENSEADSDDDFDDDDRKRLSRPRFSARLVDGLPACCFSRQCLWPAQPGSKYCTPHSDGIMRRVQQSLRDGTISFDLGPITLPQGPQANRYAEQLQRITDHPERMVYVDFEFLSQGNGFSPIPLEVAVSTASGPIVHAGVDWNIRTAAELTKAIKLARPNGYDLGTHSIAKYYAESYINRWINNQRKRVLSLREIRAEILKAVPEFHPDTHTVVTWYCWLDISIFRNIMSGYHGICEPHRELGEQWDYIDMGRICKNMTREADCHQLGFVHQAWFGMQGLTFHDASVDLRCLKEITAKVLKEKARLDGKDESEDELWKAGGGRHQSRMHERSIE